MKRILVLGATSAIAEAACHQWAQRGDRLLLMGRSEPKLLAVRNDLVARYQSSVEIIAADVADPPQHDELWRRAEEILGQVDQVLVAYGVLGDPVEAEKSFAVARDILEVNFTSAVSWSLRAAQVFQARHAGCLAVISSVAGDRGRASNYVYGAAKGGLSLFLQGLRQRLYGTGVRVVTIKPGFVDTPMTAHLRKNKLFASPEQVAADIVRAMDYKNGVIYTPGWWRVIMFIIRVIPEPVFQRLKL